ncbi:MAG: Rpn family recombination-promoting nuclease/putative transposase [Anaeroplasma sp.]|nr:Rpn family recombination-promoting nuclease/putative transposase [Anaeroplasma sp.]
MYYKNEKELNMCLTNDALFKGYYSNASNLSTLLSLILKEKIKPNDINYQPNEIIVEFEGKKPRFDLRVSILNELDIDIEMQNNKEKYFKERIYYYFASMIMSSVREGKSYKTDKNYLSIWLMNSNISLFDNSYYEEFGIISKNTQNEFIENKCRIIIIDLKKLDYCDNIELKTYLSMIESNDNIIKNLDSSNDLIKMEAKKMNDYLKSNEAFQIAIERLKSESFHNVSIIEAKEEGIEEGKKEIILNMHKKGISKEDIADMTGINIEKINKTLNM